MRFKIKLHLSKEGTVRCENVSAGYWYETLPGQGNAIKTCVESSATEHKPSEALAAFDNAETYTLVVENRREIQAKRMGTSKLFRVFNPVTKKWYGRVDPNEPLHWVSSRHEAVSLAKHVIERRFPDFLFEMIWS